jgi:hypothetical protein
MDYSFNDCIGPETLYREYKEFSLHKTGISFDIKQAELYCETNIFAFDDLVKQNLIKYIDQYIPKYISSFWNSGIDGEIYIGTDDYGIIKGIPLTEYTPLDEKWLTDYITKIVQANIKSTSPFDINIKVDIVKVTKPEPIDGLHPMYLTYLEKKYEFLELYKDFLTSYDEWKQAYEIVNMKLVDIVNHPHTRLVLIEFIKSSPLRNDNVIKTLLDDSFRLPSLSGEDIKDLKYDVTSVFYWVTTLKDELSIGYKKDKPVFLHKFKERSIPYNLIMGMSELIPFWKNIQLYLIRIQCGKQTSSAPFCYMHNGTTIQCNRIIDPLSNQPMCVPS